MIKIVLDTNVFISAIMSPDGTCAEILKEWSAGRFTLLVSGAILEELTRVMKYPGIAKIHKYSNKEIMDFVQYIQDYSSIMTGGIKIDVVKEDPADNAIIACAVEGKADYIISGDSHLLKIGSYQKISIVSPGDFMRDLQK
ncbi:MAG: putative toxin-antitoxin system toxin component, PIN family [Candidatus Eremiobacteraeota bacterium]|nr:putative toxin-antitoxin system toxin component, PIN family [Candidatus Eremiobacteraeota bacterium]